MATCFGLCSASWSRTPFLIVRVPPQQRASMLQISTYRFQNKGSQALTTHASQYDTRLSINPYLLIACFTDSVQVGPFQKEGWRKGARKRWGRLCEMSRHVWAGRLSCRPSQGRGAQGKVYLPSKPMFAFCLPARKSTERDAVYASYFCFFSRFFL